MDSVKAMFRIQQKQSQIEDDSCASKSNDLVSLSYSMAAFSTNSFGNFVIIFMHESNCVQTNANHDFV